MLLLSGLLFFLGLFLGSFLLVVIDRLPQKKSVLRGRSHCEFCGHTLSAFDLFPVVSYLLLRGKCRYCHHTLSLRYPVYELITGLLYALTPFLLAIDMNALFTYQTILLLLFTLYTISVLLLVFAIDLKMGIIPFVIVLPASVITILYLLVLSPVSIPGNILTACVSAGFFLFIHLLTRGRGMGFGDVVLAGYFGLLLGFPLIVPALYTAFLTGAGVSLILILSGRKKLKGSTIPFGPFLVLGAYISYFFGDALFTVFFKIMFRS